MKKFVTNMLYAIGAYVFIYAMLIGYMHIAASNTREYCEQLIDGMSLQAAQQLAQQKQLHTELLSYENQNKVLLVKQQPDDKAVCKIFLNEQGLQKKQFEQHIF
ncbi:MAG: hypothetical protein PVG66_10945 [Chromatiales bacterium]|jgi:hypothetical protein